MMDVANRNGISEIFDHIRNRERKSLQDYQFYVAADPHSSAFYGPIQIITHAETDHLMFDPLAGDSPSDLNIIYFSSQKNHIAYSDNILQKKKIVTDAIEQEKILERYPQLKTCLLNRADDLRDFSILVFLAAEADHVSFISYYGLSAAYHPWLQVLGEWSLNSIQLGHHLLNLPPHW